MPPTEPYKFYSDGIVIKQKLLATRHLDVVREECDDAIIKAWRSGLDIEKDYGCILDCPVPAGEYSLECYRRMRSENGHAHPLTPIIVAVAAWVKETLAITQQLYFLNEQYICKPSRASGSSFKWHTDSEYIKAGDVSLDYVSVWIPLDKVSEKNGGLIVRPFDKGTLSPKRWDSTNLKARRPDDLYESLDEAGEEITGVPLLLEAGAAVLMSSFLLHCSSPNVSSNLRRVWMLQYSTDKKISGGKTYKYAVPCGAAAV